MEPYEVAYRAAYNALEAVGRRTLRDILAENVAAHVIGANKSPVGRWTSLTSDDTHRARVVRNVTREFPETVTISSGPVDAAVKAAAEALLAEVEA